MIRQYYYNKQLKQYIVMFANLFVGLKVQAGKDECGCEQFIDVPIVYGSMDRVVASIGARNTQNQQFGLPIMSCYMQSLELAPDRMKGVNQVDKRTVLEQGGIYPTDLKAIRRVMPIPYDLTFELAIYASNTDQLLQILEQVLILFDYDLQVQRNDSPYDWTKITSVYLEGINNEENYPLGTDRRVINWTLTFRMPAWLSPPAEVREKLIQSIAIRFGDLEGLDLSQIDENGNLQPFDDPNLFTSFTITPSPEGGVVVTPGTPDESVHNAVVIGTSVE
jgi:hypothetical protein